MGNSGSGVKRGQNITQFLGVFWIHLWRIVLIIPGRNAPHGACQK
jgi:hypothetical protein